MNSESVHFGGKTLRPTRADATVDLGVLPMKKKGLAKGGGRDVV